MGYLFESEVYWGGGGNFGGPVTERGSHTKKVGDHCSSGISPPRNLTWDAGFSVGFVVLLRNLSCAFMMQSSMERGSEFMDLAVESRCRFCDIWPLSLFLLASLAVEMSLVLHECPAPSGDSSCLCSIKSISIATGSVGFSCTMLSLLCGGRTTEAGDC